MNTTWIEHIRKIPGIVEAKELALRDEVKEKMGPDFTVAAEENAQKINVYRIVYMSNNHKVVGYIVEPKEGDNLPCVISNRGGSNDFGSIKIGHLFLNLSRFARGGYITIMSQYSGNSGSEGVDQMGGEEVNDILELYKILKEYPRADASRIGMYGGSRGGMMTYLVLAQVDWVKAAVIVAGSADLVSKKNFRPEMEDHYIKMFGGSEEEKIKRSALFWSEKLPKTTPVLLMHGTSDWRVNPFDSIDMAKKLHEHKVPYRLVMFEGGDHKLLNFKAEASKMTLNWFDRFVKNGEPLPNMEQHGD